MRKRKLSTGNSNIKNSFANFFKSLKKELKLDSNDSSNIAQEKKIDSATEESSEQRKNEMTKQAELVIRNACYQELYESIENLEAGYLSKQSGGNRLDEVKFITSVQYSLPKPKEVGEKLNLKEINSKIDLTEKSYHTLIGACLYIHQRIKDDYYGSWSASFWATPETGSALFNLLNNLLISINTEIKQQSISQIKISFLLGEIDNISYPLAKGAKVPETNEQFKDNLDKYFEVLCPKESGAPSLN